MANFTGIANVKAALKRLDMAPELSGYDPITIVVIGGAALYFYGVNYRQTADVDFYLSASKVVQGVLSRIAPQFGLFFEGGNVAWLPEDWQAHARHSGWRFKHLDVWVLDEYGFIVSKMARWEGHDSDDVCQVIPKVNMERLRELVKQNQELYIGHRSRLRSAWRDVCEMANRPDLNSLD